MASRRAASAARTDSNRQRETGPADGAETD
jgi:hypothetical protein